jgi:hypothetical protein
MANGDAFAIRPFVVDDARVVGDGRAQVESWALHDRHELIHNVLGAFGPTNWFETTLGFFHGGIHQGVKPGYSITGPLFQLKALAREAKPDTWPGIAFVLGTLPPLGYGPFTNPGVHVFGYTAVTQNLFDDDLLLHSNLGFTTIDEKTHWLSNTIGGFGFQARAIGGLHAVAEIYHGDPYDPLFRDWASQVGFRYIVSDNFQFDGTVGSSLTGDSWRWWTLGIRLVSDPLW